MRRVGNSARQLMTDDQHNPAEHALSKPQAIPQPPVPPVAAPIMTPQANVHFVPPPLRPARLASGTVALAIVMAYLGLGLALSWGIQQNRQRRALQDQFDRARTATDLVISQEDDLGRFLAQRNTLSIPLSGSPEGPVKSASVAWNGDLHEGRLFCDGLQTLWPPRTCQLWFGGKSGYVNVIRFEPIPGQDIYQFHAETQTAAPSEIILTHGTAADSFDHIAPMDILARGRVAPLN
jgi:hypothetical protein